MANEKQSDALYLAACQLAWVNPSLATLTRRLRAQGHDVGYTDATQMLERMVSEGVISDYAGRQKEPVEHELRARIAELEAWAQELSKIIRNAHVANQAAWIEWRYGKGAEAGMQWIENGLCGPGLIPDENEPYGKEPQAWFDANKAAPFPACFCGRPSNQLWMGKGFCSIEHYDQHRAAIAQEGGKS